MYYIAQDLPTMPKHITDMRNFDAFEIDEYDAKIVLGIVLNSLTPNIPANSLSDEDINYHLRKIFWGHAYLERYQLMIEILNPKLEEDKKITTHIFNKIKLIKRLKISKDSYDKQHGISLCCLISTQSYTKFVKDFLKDEGETIEGLIKMVINVDVQIS